MKNLRRPSYFFCSMITVVAGLNQGDTVPCKEIVNPKKFVRGEGLKKQTQGLSTLGTQTSTGAVRQAKPFSR